MPSTSIKLLGSFELRVEPDSRAILTSRKAKVLLALLALGRGRPICRSAIARSLWEYSADRQARTSLRQTLLVLKKALPNRQCPWLLSDHDNLAIDLDQVDIDVHRFQSLLSEGCNASHRQAVKLYRGELLEGLSFREEAVESWLQSERDRLQLLALDSLTAILLDDTAQGNLRDALDSAKRISMIDPLREDVHRSLMQIYANLGQPQAAIRQFQICKETLSRELGITPQAETTTLYETICQANATGQSQLPISVTPAFDHSFDNLASVQDTGSTHDGFVPSAQGSIIPTLLPYSRRVAVAVLPFINLTKSAALEPLCLSLSEEVMAALVAWRNFPVVARSSVLALLGRTRDARTLGTALNALYLVEGSLKENGGQVRLNLQLVLSTQGYCVWTHSLDFPRDTNWASYDVLATKIAATIMTQLERAERDRAFVASSSSLCAWEYYQRGMHSLYQFSKRGNLRARDYFHRAIELDGTSSQAFTGLASSHHRDVYFGYTSSFEDSVEAQKSAALQAVELDDTNALAHWALGCAYGWMGSFQLAVAEEERTLALNPGMHIGYCALGWLANFMGQPERAVDLIEKGLNLNPEDPRNHLYITILANAQLNARNYDEAERWARVSIKRRPDYLDAYLVLAATLGHQGNRSESQRLLERLERHQLDQLENHPLWRSYREPVNREHAIKGLKQVYHG